MLNSIMVVDDHPAIGHGTKMMLERRFNCHVSYVMKGSQAIELLKTQSFDLVITDYMMPAMDGISLAKELKKIEPNVKIIVYSGFDLDTQYNEWVDTGIFTVISKDSSIDDLEQIIQCAMKDLVVLPSNLVKKLRLPASFVSKQTDEIRKHQLDEADIELLFGIFNGYSNKELAERFHRSQRSVEYHIAKLYGRFNVKSRWQLMRYVMKNQLLDDIYREEESV